MKELIIFSNNNPNEKPFFMSLSSSASLLEQKNVKVSIIAPYFMTNNVVFFPSNFFKSKKKRQPK
jgi:hypothetical protein